MYELMFMSTILVKEVDFKRNWYVIDATDMILGRVSVVIADLLRGRGKRFFAPHIDCGDYVIVINADKVKMTGGKEYKKYIFRHTGYPGGIKQTTPLEILGGKNPVNLMRRSIKGMIPRNKLGRDIYRKLFIYTGQDHPHEAQKPIVFENFIKKDSI